MGFAPHLMDWELARPLLARLLALPEAEREGVLERECDGDPRLRDRMRSLLAAGHERRDLLEPPPREGARAALAAGDLVGAWRLERPLGAGGMGEVWLAERADSDFRQRVAIKVVKRGMDTDEVLRRFRRERKVLAALEHPSMPHLIDGGATDDGRPYLVMEYVDGQPLDAYVRARGLDLEARLELFLEVCEAVQFAHERGIVHRDLKPSNVLVTGGGEPRLLDFGISKVLEAGEGFGTLELTLTGQQMLTPRYASPEQVRGEPVTAAADVYALGLLLWELLIGRPALEVEALTQVDLREAICERSVPRPSLAVEATETGLKRALAGDLDTICLMALRKEPERRYASVQLMADDLRRHLEGHPVAARPDTMTYRVSKFVRRNRTLVGGVVATFVVLVMGLVATFFLYHQARRAAGESERIAYTANLESAEASLREGLVGLAREKLERAPEHLRGWEWEHFASRLDRSSWSTTLGAFSLTLALDLSADGRSIAGGAHADLLVLRDREEVLRIEGTYPTSVSWSPDARHLAWCDLSGAVWTVEVALGPEAARCLLEGDGSQDAPLQGCGVAWSPDGGSLASSHRDGSVRVFDVASGQVRVQFTAHEPREALVPLAWHPDGHLLASGSWDRTVQLYDAQRGEHLGGWRAHSMAVQSVDFDAEGGRLVTCSKDETIVVWDVETRATLATLRPHPREVKQARFLPGGEQIVSADGAGSIHITSWRTAEVLAVLPGHEQAVVDLEVSGGVLASIDVGGSLRLWDTKTRDVRGARTCEFTNTICPSPDGRRFATCAPDRTVRIWNLEGTGVELERELYADHGYVLGLDWSPDGEWIASAHHKGGRVLLWNARTGALERELEAAAAVGVVFTHGGREVASLHAELGSEEGRLRTWRTSTGEPLGEQVLPVSAPIGSHRNHLERRSNGTLLAVTLYGCLALDEAGDGSRLVPLEHTAHMGLAYREDPGLLAVCTSVGVALLDPKTGALLSELPVGEDCVAVAFHPDGSRLALGTGERIELWDPDLPERVATLHGHAGRIQDLAWTADGRTLLSVDAGGWVRVWETR